MSNTAVVLAGGVGKRMGTDQPKQFLSIHGRPVLFYTLWAFEQSEDISEIILVTRKEDMEYCRKEIVDRYAITKVTGITEGGAERFNSVYNGLIAIKNPEGLVLIHDGARPCVTPGLIHRLCMDAQHFGNAIAAVPSKDTVKLADKDGYVTSTPDRSLVWNVQTPQVFPKETIREAYKTFMADLNRKPVTDDAMVAELYSQQKIHLTMGEYTNIKITTPDDLPMAEKFLE